MGNLEEQIQNVVRRTNTFYQQTKPGHYLININYPVETPDIPPIALPSQGTWDSWTDIQKADWLIDREREDRGLPAFHGPQEDVTTVAQDYAEYLIDNNAWGHNEDGTLTQRLNRVMPQNYRQRESENIGVRSSTRRKPACASSRRKSAIHTSSSPMNKAR